MNTRSVASAFAEAGRTLGFAFEPGFSAQGFRFVGLVRGFGRQHGTLIVAEGEEPAQSALDALSAAGYSYAVVTGSYEEFEYALFRDTLNDWGFYGEDAMKPSWYTGKEWR